MSQTFIPLVPSHVAGPLGVLHLPRLWLKVSLDARGKGDKDYPSLQPGYDTMVVAALNLNADALRKFVADKKPSYAEFEAWVKAQPGVKLDRATVYKINSEILGYHHGDAVRKTILADAGYPDDGTVQGGATELNFLDDLAAFHRSELK